MVEGRFFIRIARIIISALTFLLPLNATAKSTLTRAQVLEDARTLEDLLKRYHPNLYAHRTPKQIGVLWANAKGRVPDSPDYLDAATMAQQMLAAVCDEHTEVRVNASRMYEDNPAQRFFSSGIVAVGDNLYLDNSLLARKEERVVSINGRSSAIEDYFDLAFELETNLRGKEE